MVRVQLLPHPFIYYFSIPVTVLQDYDMVQFPEFILIQTISYCNARCLICPYADTVPIQEQGRMDLDLFKRIIDEASLYQNQVKQIMPYLMNEPLLDRSLAEKIKYIHLKNPNAWIHIVTNGSLFDDEITDQILNSPVNSIKISMLGHRKATYEKVMGLSNYDIVLERIVRFTEKALQLKGDDFVSVCFTNTPGYVPDDEIAEVKKFWEAKGVKYEIINHPISRAGNVKIMDAPRHRHISGCTSIWRDDMIHILFNGDVVLCCMDWRREVVLGNVRERTIEEIWNGSRYDEIRKIIDGREQGDSNFLCYRCEAAIKQN